MLAVAVAVAWPEDSSMAAFSDGRRYRTGWIGWMFESSESGESGE